MDNDIVQSEHTSERVMATLKQMSSMITQQTYDDIMDIAATFIRMGESTSLERKENMLKYYMVGLILSDGVLRLQTELAKAQQFEEEMGDE